MLNLLTPRLLIGIAIVATVAGIVALYAGYPSLGPVGLFVGVIASILAAIMITTPQAAVQTAYAQLSASSAEPTASVPAARSESSASSAASVSEQPTDDDAPSA